VAARSQGEFDATAANSGSIDVSGYGSDGVRAFGYFGAYAGAEATNADESTISATQYGVNAKSHNDTATATNSGGVTIVDAGN
jgi:hypothetical protein